MEDEAKRDETDRACSTHGYDDQCRLGCEYKTINYDFDWKSRLRWESKFESGS
jgi:hypothetical protein